MDKDDLKMFSANLKTLYGEIINKDLDHFDFFGLPKTATQKEIEEGYRGFLTEFHPDKGELIKDPDDKDKFDYILNRGRTAFNVISNYEKRAQYEKNGFREMSSDEEKEEESTNKSKNLYKKAKTLYHQQKFDIAITALKQSIELEEKADSFLLMGLCQANFVTMKKEAEQSLLKAAELESWNPEPYVALGMLFYSEKLFKRAEGYFRKVLEIEPGHELAGKKLNEIAGPDRKDILGDVQDKLKKAIPSIFSKKKK
ncbi:MAG: DnaJ domain-containing protein [Acidobacteriota bacterium]